MNTKDQPDFQIVLMEPIQPTASDHGEGCAGCGSFQHRRLSRNI
jgi:hypothetical protein